MILLDFLRQKLIVHENNTFYSILKRCNGMLLLGDANRVVYMVLVCDVFSLLLHSSIVMKLCDWILSWDNYIKWRKSNL